MSNKRQNNLSYVEVNIKFAMSLNEKIHQQLRVRMVQGATFVFTVCRSLRNATNNWA